MRIKTRRQTLRRVVVGVLLGLGAVTLSMCAGFLLHLAFPEPLHPGDGSSGRGLAEVHSAAAARTAAHGGGGGDEGSSGGEQDRWAPRRAAAARTAGARVHKAAARAAAAPGAKKIGTYVETEDGNEVVQDLLDEPIPEDCYPEGNADYGGFALTWGLTYKLPSAAQCCKACKDFGGGAGGKRCNVWVWCGDPSGACWSPDIWNHTSGECWLKFQEHWDNKVDRSLTNLEVNARGAYSAAFRKEHKTAPERVPWTAGVVPGASAGAVS